MTSPQIFFLGANDWANLSHGAARAINRVVGKQVARVWTLFHHPFGYAADLVGEEGFEEARQHARGTDWVISTGDGDYRALIVMLRALELGDVRRATTHCGTTFRRDWRRYNQLDREMGFDLRFLGPDLMRLARDDPRVRPLRVVADQPSSGVVERPQGPVRVGHAPSRRSKKGTKGILPVLKQVQADVAIEVDLIEDVPHAESLVRQSRCHIFIDQLKPEVGGFGRSSTEAMSQGCATLCSMNLIEKRCWDYFERPPIVEVTTPETLERELHVLAGDPELLQRTRENSVAWVGQNASYEAVGQYWLGQLREA